MNPETRLMPCDCDGGYVYRAAVASRWALEPHETAELCTACNGKGEIEVDLQPVSEDEIMESVDG